MTTDDYAGAPVAAGEGLLQMPGFWAAYLQVAGGQWGDEDGLTTAEWFGISPEELAEAEKALYGKTQWPAIRIPFSDGHAGRVTRVWRQGWGTGRRARLRRGTACGRE